MCWQERRGHPALSYQASPRSETHTCKVHQFLIVCGSLIWNAPSPSRSLEILNSTGLEIVGPRHSIQVKLIQINNLRRLDFLSQFQHLGNRNTFWRHRLDSLLRTGNRAYSSLNFCVGHTVLKSSLSGASISQLGRNRTILHYISFRSDEGLTLETSALYSLRWPIYIFNLVDTTKLPILHYVWPWCRVLVFSIVNSWSSNPTWTNPLGPIREYFYASPVTSVLSLCMTISSLFLVGVFGLPCFLVLFSFIAFLNFFHLSFLSAIFIYPRPQVILVYGNDRPWRFLIQFYFYLFLF